MKLIYEPTVYLIGKQCVIDSELNRFLSDNGSPDWKTDSNSAAEMIPEIFGRLCYDSYNTPRPGGSKKYLGHIKEVGHGSVVEASVWNFIFTGISRSLTHELVRHRQFSFSQRSQRYVDEGISPEFVVPPALAEDVKYFLNNKFNLGAQSFSKDKKQQSGHNWVNSVQQSHNAYVEQVEQLFNDLVPEAYWEAFGGNGPPADYTIEQIIKALPIEARTAIRKKARESARSLLPNATETKIGVTMNARAARNFLELRGSRHADAEIRMLANKVYEVLLKDSPSLFDDYEKETLPDGGYELTTKYRKI